MMNNEPVLTAASLAGVIAAGISFARLMGWITLDDEQYNALMVFIGLLLPIVFGMWARGLVTPVSFPKIKTENGEEVKLVRADTGKPPQEK